MSIALKSREKIGRFLAESVYDNPVITREFRTRMRGWKAFTVMGSYVLLLGVVLTIAYLTMWNMYSYRYGMSMVNRAIGKDLFAVITWTQAVLLTLIIPALSFGAITQEIERKTLELLALTKLSPGKVVAGKQLSAFVYSMILLVCSLPISSLCLMFGGISPQEIAVVYAMLAVWAFLLTSVSVFWSSLFSKTAVAALFSYGFCAGYFLVTLIMGGFLMDGFYGRTDYFAVGALNPGWSQYVAVVTTKVSGLAIPVAAVAGILHTAIGVLLLLIASTHVRFLTASKALPIRILAMAITAVFTWLFVGSFCDLSSPHGDEFLRDAITIAGTTMLIFLTLMAAVFATGEIRKRKGDAVFSYASSPGKTFKNDLGGAISFMALWTVLLYGTLGLTTWIAVRLGQVVPGRNPWPAYFHVGAAILGMVIGTSAVGILVSSLVKLRRNAAALVVLFIFIAWAVYGIFLVNYVDGMTDTSGPAWQLAALWPLTPILGSTGGWTHMPKLWWPVENSWMVSILVYIGRAAVALAIAERALARFGGVKDERDD